MQDMAHLHLDHCIATIGDPLHKREHNKDSVSKSKNLCNVLKEPKTRGSLILKFKKKKKNRTRFFNFQTSLIKNHITAQRSQILCQHSVWQALMLNDANQ